MSGQGTASRRSAAILKGKGRAGRATGSTRRRGSRSRRSGGSWRARVGQLARDIEHAEFFTPAEPVAFAVHDSTSPGDMRITIRGNVHALGDLVPRGFVRVVSRNRPALIPSGESGRRQLADWIASGDNPLTARVAVNRIWQRLFGEGIVRSVDYFGSRGETPTHPELLDALALRFVADGWSQKRLIRSLVLSRAYAMSSAHDSRSDAVDPDNRLLWRMNRRRLDAESLRDVMLAVAGTLTACGGGPGLPLEYPENTGGLRKGDVNPPELPPGQVPAGTGVRAHGLSADHPLRLLRRARRRCAMSSTLRNRASSPASACDHRADPGLVPDECQDPEAAGPRAGPADNGRLGR